MSRPQFNTWQAIQAEVLRRIHAREWPPGHVIPNEVDLTAEFGCARATVNRALRALAEAGVLERRRKAGTRVALHPVSRATVDIPVIRQEIEGLGKDYGYAKLVSNVERSTVNSPIEMPGGSLHIAAVHTMNGTPYVHENRWISLETVPDAASQNFNEISANEWLIMNAPYTHGDIVFTATAAGEEVASALRTKPGAPIFVIDRTTWDGEDVVTTVRLSYAPGHQIHTRIGA